MKENRQIFSSVVVGSLYEQVVRRLKENSRRSQGLKVKGKVLVGKVVGRRRGLRRCQFRRSPSNSNFP